MMTEGSDDPRPDWQGFQRWLRNNRGKIWIWVIGGVALGGIACMLIVVLILIARQQ